MALTWPSIYWLLYVSHRSQILCGVRFLLHRWRFFNGVDERIGEGSFDGRIFVNIEMKLCPDLWSFLKHWCFLETMKTSVIVGVRHLPSAHQASVRRDRACCFPPRRPRGERSLLESFLLCQWHFFLYDSFWFFLYWNNLELCRSCSYLLFFWEAAQEFPVLGFDKSKDGQAS